MRLLRWGVRLLAGIAVVLATSVLGRDTGEMNWRAGFGRRVITPQTPVWLAGYGSKREPDGKIHDLWVKVLALQASDGKRVVIATTDHMGMSKTIYESIYAKLFRRYSLARPEFMLTFSHNHCGPALKDDLVDYYPTDDTQRRLIAEYSDWMEDHVVEAVGEALANLQPAQLRIGESKCTFAVNRRDNTEVEVSQKLAEGTPLKGVVDHTVPVLAIRDDHDKLLGVLFGYACHPTTLSFNTWCGDYPGFAQVNLETNHAGASAMFFNACGGDQNPVPRRKMELCERYGKMLSDAVETALLQPMHPVSVGLRSAFEFVDLAYEERVTREKLLPIANGNSALHARWAKRMLKKLEEGVVLPMSYPYPVQAWQIGNTLLLIGIGGEAVVDYSLRFKREFGPTTWVCGYANDMVAYIPSRRVWEEGGYEGGSHLDEYGRPAWRWAGDVEDRIAQAVHRVVEDVRRCPQYSAPTPSSADDLYYIAHRGEYMKLVEQLDSKGSHSVVDAPEGTRPAYERVRDRMVNAVKLDVTYTSDNVIVMSHDTNLKRVTGQNLPILKTTYADLKNAPFIKCGDYSDERVMTLDETLDIVKGCERFYLDFKYSTPDMIKDVIKKFQEHGIPSEKIIIATFNMDALKDAQKLCPDIRRVLHISFGDQTDGTLSLNGRVKCADFTAAKAQLNVWKKEFGLYGFNLPTHSKYTTRELIRELKAEGTWLTLWYVHSTEIADTFVNSGVDGFVTGSASSIRDYLKAKAKKP